jgi:hypothetical protein
MPLNALGAHYGLGLRPAPETMYRAVELHRQGVPMPDIALSIGKLPKTCAKYIELYGRCASPAEVAALAPARGGRREECVVMPGLAISFLAGEVARDPALGLAEYEATLASALGVIASQTQICYVLNHELKEHMKNVTTYFPERHSPANLIRTQTYLNTMMALDAGNVFFFDETAVNHRGCAGRRRGRAPPGVRCNVERQNAHGYYRWSVNCMLSIKAGCQPVYWNAVPRSTSAQDLYSFMHNAVHRDGALTRGDVVVMDNCRTHHQHERALVDMLSAAGVGLVYLPTYSPHLNPIELFFNTLKYHLNRHHSHELRTQAGALVAIAKAITAKACPMAALGYYSHCGYL